MWGIVIFWNRGDAVIGQMNESIIYFFSIIVSSWETDIALIIEPNRQRVEISDHYPLTNVKFTTQDDQRTLNVLLSNPEWLFTFNMVLDLDKVVVAYDTSSSGQTCRF